jgi:hypothetical protein
MSTKYQAAKRAYLAISDFSQQDVDLMDATYIYRQLARNCYNWNEDTERWVHVTKISDADYFY